MRTNPRSAFTRTELVLVVFVIFLLLAMVLPMLARSQRKSSKIGCVNCLKQMGIAFRIWEGDNGDKYPMAVAATNGGAAELVVTGNVVACFQVMSNELASPRILVCPDDNRHHYATNFETLAPQNLSYFVGVDAKESDPESILSGDANLTRNDLPLAAGVWNLRTNTVGWSADRHKGYGNLLIGDGSVQTGKRAGFVSAPGDLYATNRIAVP